MKAVSNPARGSPAKANPVRASNRGRAASPGKAANRARGGQPGGGGQQPGGGAAGGGQPGGAASGNEGGPSRGADAANLEFAKKSADLALDKLRDQLDRGEVDDELLKELGWTEEQARRFADRLADQLAADPDAADPREAARQKQFEEMLKALGRRQNAPSVRTGADIEGRDPGGVGPRDLPVPPEYEELYRAFRRSVARDRGEE